MILGIALVALGLGGALAAAGIHFFADTEQPAAPTATGPAAPTLDLSGFDPGNIITDKVFYDYQSMTQADIENFIRDKNAGCVSLSTPCLADYTEDTIDVPASPRCEGYQGAPGESAATIIYKTAQSCKINPQVLLVLLQKEQGLLTASDYSLSPRHYEVATGFACPDGADCDPQYFGFGTQVYYAAAQFQRYRQSPAQFPFHTGVANNIPYSPLASCGSAPVILANQATTALYNYTPYQPDSALLSGTPGECSSYGNANFYGIFKTWFGDSRR
ncbi:hemagglutinin [uncultured Mobiluncus sp.]|uniref:hemagglutinin n=1 Tax=uncultured Mobiluncus sp. TaxID=293425 RepID=UPI0028039682|nr:hemagglutinin [uncultured Mobiluncus sp.]